MTIDAIKRSIQEKITVITEKTLAIRKPHNTEDVLDIVNAYSDVFNNLFGEPGKPESYIQLMEANPNKENIDFYLRTLCDLRKKIEGLPFDAAIKGTMLGKLSEYCNLRVLTTFEKDATLSKKEYQQVLVDLHPESLIDTVQVRTWGTKREISNGFRNVILQQMRGEGVGHASVTMRFKADERGKELIQKYCQTEDGSIKIPYQLKQYGEEAIYEVYWSFWPSGLETLESDIRTEHSGVEHQDDVEILSAMPLELRSRYLFQKYTKDQRLPILGSLGADGQPLFTSNVPGSRKMGLLVDSIDASRAEPDIFRRNYLELKVQQYKIEEEISALELLRDNYLAEDKPFSTSSITDTTKIKPNSNFLILLKRFLPQLADKTAAAQVLLHNEITKEQSKILESELSKLITLKEQQRKKLDAPIKQAAGLIYENYAELNFLRDQVEELKESVDHSRRSLKHARIVLIVLENTSRLGEPYSLTEKEKESFAQFSETFSSQPEVSALINKIIDRGSIEPGEVSLLRTPFITYERTVNKDMLQESKKLSTKTEELHVVYASKTRIKLTFLEERVDKINLALARSKDELEGFELFKIKATPILEMQQKLDLCTTALATADNAMLHFIEESPKSKKGKKGGKVEVASKAFEITYDSVGGPKTTTIKTFDEALQAKKDIADAIDGLRKEQKAITRDTSGPDVSEIAEDSVGANKGKNKKKRAEKEGEVVINFTYHDAAGKECIKSIRSFRDLDSVRSSLATCQPILEGQKNETLGQLIRLKMSRDSSIADLNQRLRRGSSNDAFLRGFDIEKMLARASDMASRENAFHLANENCSTTSMKVLQAGAPSDAAFMFDWHQPREGETVGSNMFLTNPQTVYSAVKTVESAAKGDPDARALIAQRRIATPERSYNTLLNELASSMTTYNNVSVELPGKNFHNAADPSKFSWSFYLKFIPHLLKLYRDIFQTAKLQQEQVSNSLEAQMSRELKALNGQNYYIIDSTSPSLAINRLCEALKANKTNIPFFNTDTLSRVELYVLAIQSKEPQTEKEINTLKNYQDIIAERDERVKCVENALLAGDRTKDQLEKREVATEKLTWVMTDKEKSEALVTNFIYKYQEIRNKNALSFLTPNFLTRLESCDSVEKKLMLIKQHIAEDPKSRSAQALSECCSQDELLKKTYSQAPLTNKGNANLFFVDPKKQFYPSMPADLSEQLDTINFNF